MSRIKKKKESDFKINIANLRKGFLDAEVDLDLRVEAFFLRLFFFDRWEEDLREVSRPLVLLVFLKVVELLLVAPSIVDEDDEELESWCLASSSSSLFNNSSDWFSNADII